MYNEENNEEIRIEDQKEMGIKSYIDSRTGLVHQDYSWFFEHSCGDDQD